jgi:hypothetical protein
MSAAHELTLLRLCAQLIAGPGAATVLEAVHHLGALQAQDHPGMLTSVALRTHARRRSDVEAAFSAGQIVKSWPLRGTLHVVTTEDLRWLLELTAARVVATSTPRRTQLGLTDTDLHTARDLTEDALAGHRELTRAELMTLWERAGLVTAGQRGYHLLWHLAQTATVCFGPVREGRQQLVLVDEWCPPSPPREREEALADLAGRYFRGHGPATAKDFGRWAKLLAADVRAGVGAARPALASLEVDGVQYLMDPATAQLLTAARRQARGVFLLPGFDEYVLGYADRSLVLAPEFADVIVPGGNGMFRPTVVADGAVVGTWKRTGRVPAQELQASAFTTFSAALEAAIGRAGARLPA